jgi:hypothetical protein
MEVINVQNPKHSKLIEGIYLNDTDPNEVKFDNNKIFVVSDRSLASSSLNKRITKGEVAEVIEFLGNKSGAMVVESPVPSFSANGDFRHGNIWYIIGL